MSQLYGRELEKYQTLRFDSKFHELWTVGGAIYLKPIEGHE